MHNDSEIDHLAEINMVPLIDVMLVLLIVFMICAPLSVTGVEVQLPNTKSRAQPIENQESKVILTVAPDGKFHVEGQAIEEGDLQSKLKALFAHRQSKNLYIRGDREVKYQRVVDAMTIAKQAGIDKVAMLTKPIQ